MSSSKMLVLALVACSTRTSPPLQSADSATDGPHDAVAGNDCVGCPEAFIREVAWPRYDTDAAIPAADALPDTSLDSPAGTDAPAAVQSGLVVITEFMADPKGVSDDKGEWIEIYCASDEPVNIGGWVLRDDGLDIHVIIADESIVIEPGQYFVLGSNPVPDLNGGVAIDYSWSGFTLGNIEDEIVLEADGAVVDRVAYAAGSVVPGVASSLAPDSLDALSNDDPSHWCSAWKPFGDGGLGTPGLANPECGGTPPEPPADTAQPDTSQPDTWLPDTIQPDTAQPDSAVLDTALPDALQPDSHDSVQADTAQLDSTQPGPVDTAPDAAVTESVPDSAP